MTPGPSVQEPALQLEQPLSPETTCKGPLTHVPNDQVAHDQLPQTNDHTDDVPDLPSATVPEGRDQPETDAHQQARPRGRPPGSKKQRGFRGTPFASMQQQLLAECPSPGTSPAQPLVDPGPIAPPQRPHRVRKKPDWYTADSLSFSELSASMEKENMFLQIVTHSI